MKLRQIASHHYTVLAVLDPVEGDSVLAILRDAERFHRRLFEQMTAALYRYTPTSGPPFVEQFEKKRHGTVTAKRLDIGISEFVALNEEPSRRQRAKQSEDERRTGIRVFFFEYGRDVVCTNACYKISPTPPGAISAALRIRDDFHAAVVAGEYPEILEED
jgi:hypothetical protein